MPRTITLDQYKNWMSHHEVNSDLSRNQYASTIRNKIFQGSNTWHITSEMEDDPENVIKTLIPDNVLDANQRAHRKKFIDYLEDTDPNYAPPHQDAEIQDDQQDDQQEDLTMNEISVNTILFGPPGTGKTYNTIAYALAICDGEEGLDRNGLEIDNKGNPTVDFEEYETAQNRFKTLKENGQIAFTTFHQSYGYEEFIEGIKPKISPEVADGEIQYEYFSGIFKKFCNEAKDHPDDNYVFIIDEINRGNISKIFGELITLIEDTKRIGNGQTEATTVKLPYTGEDFGVPKNVYILGTMNTADRSIALMDTALRRRFNFVEMLPDPNVLNGIVVDEINIQKMLTVINQRVEALYDREHTIGHAFFTKLLNAENQNIQKLNEIFRNKVIPLLQEYFYEDYEKIQLILGKKFVDNDTERVSWPANVALPGDLPQRYKITANWNAASYKSIYMTGLDQEEAPQ
jgi:5-methylcytosine-specific restriction endonuclease McrBC GTP-binding regulatory subunit McrB